MHAALLLLLVACTSNLFASASPTPDMKPRTPTREQLHSLSGSGHSVVAVRGGQAHQPRELAKRYITQTDRRVLRIAIDAAVAAAWQIATTYVIDFDYYYNSATRSIENSYNGDNGRTMELPGPQVVNQFVNGVDIAIPAFVGFAAGPAARLVARFAWGARLRTDSNVVAGMALMELEVVTLQGIHRIAPGLYSWTFNQGLPP